MLQTAIAMLFLILIRHLAESNQAPLTSTHPHHNETRAQSLNSLKLFGPERIWPRVSLFDADSLGQLGQGSTLDSVEKFALRHLVGVYHTLSSSVKPIKKIGKKKARLIKIFIGEFRFGNKGFKNFWENVDKMGKARH